MLPTKIEEFFNYRKAMKKPIRSKERFLNKLMKLSNGDEATMIEILDNSMDNDWQGIFAIKKEPVKVNKITESNNILNNVLFNIENGSI